MTKAKEKPAEPTGPVLSGITNQLVRVADCKPHPENYNRHEEGQIGDLRVSLKRFGQVRSIVVQDAGDGTFLLVAGHGVQEAARREKWAELKADVIPKDWPPEMVLAYLAADNELARHGMPDEAQLAQIVDRIATEVDEELARLAAGGAEELQGPAGQGPGGRPARGPRRPDGQGRGAADQVGDRGRAVVEDPVEVGLCAPGRPGAVPEVRPEARHSQSLPGGRIMIQCECGCEFDADRQVCHLLLCGDSTMPQDVGRLMGDDKASLVATDPPYGVAYDGNQHRNKYRKGVQYERIENDDLEGEDFEDFLTYAFRALRRFVREDALWYVWHASSTRTTFLKALDAVGIEVHQEIVWAKEGFQLGRSDYHWQHEPCLYGWGKSHKFYGGRSQSTVWQISRQTDHLHPTTKPVELWTRPMENNTEPGDVVVDTFLGSGTALVAAEQTGRLGRGLELAPAYVAVTLERMLGLGLVPVLVGAEESGGFRITMGIFALGTVPG